MPRFVSSDVQPSPRGGAVCRHPRIPSANLAGFPQWPRPRRYGAPTIAMRAVGRDPAGLAAPATEPAETRFRVARSGDDVEGRLLPTRDEAAPCHFPSCRVQATPTEKLASRATHLEDVHSVTLVTRLAWRRPQFAREVAHSAVPQPNEVDCAILRRAGRAPTTAKGDAFTDQRASLSAARTGQSGRVACRERDARAQQADSVFHGRRGDGESVRVAEQPGAGTDTRERPRRHLGRAAATSGVARLGAGGLDLVHHEVALGDAFAQGFEARAMRGRRIAPLRLTAG